MPPCDRETQWFYESLKLRNQLFIGQKHPVKHIIAKNRTKNKNKKDSPWAVFFMQENKLFLTRFRITIPAFPV